MKITKSRLQKIIKEELDKFMSEEASFDFGNYMKHYARMNGDVDCWPGGESRWAHKEKGIKELLTIGREETDLFITLYNGGVAHKHGNDDVPTSIDDAEAYINNYLYEEDDEYEEFERNFPDEGILAKPGKCGYTKRIKPKGDPDLDGPDFY
jgi:hypothetical protein